MLFAVVFAVLAASAVVDSQSQYYSYSPSVGAGGGYSYVLTGTGRITGVRVWHNYSGYIRGIQFRYGAIWTRLAGHAYGVRTEIELFEGETIIQISGYYGHYVHSLVFVTNRGRSLYAGHHVGSSFNMYPKHNVSELRFISGRINRWSYLTAIGAHWGIIDGQ